MSSFRLVVVCTLGLLAASLLDIPTALASSQDPLNLAQFTQDGGNVVQSAFHHPSPSSPIGATSPAIPPPSQPTPQPKPQSQKGQPQGEPLETSPTPAQPQSGPPYVYDPSGTYPDPSAQAWAYHYAHGGMDPAGAVYFFSVPGVTDRLPVSDHPAVPHALPTRRKGLSVFGDDDEDDEDDEDDGPTLMHYAQRKPQRDSRADQPEHPWEDAEIERLACLLRLTIVMVVGMALLAFKVRYNLLRPRKGDGDVVPDEARAAQDNVDKQEDSTVVQKC